MMFYDLYFFFFKQKTAYEMRISDWSSDVCSSDLFRSQAEGLGDLEREGGADHRGTRPQSRHRRVYQAELTPRLSPQRRLAHHQGDDAGETTEADPAEPDPQPEMPLKDLRQRGLAAAGDGRHPLHVHLQHDHHQPGGAGDAVEQVADDKPGLPIAVAGEPHQPEAGDQIGRAHV